MKNLASLVVEALSVKFYNKNDMNHWGGNYLNQSHVLIFYLA